ncbi:MAG: carboxypeptidase regulatory-like domain-containing protein, partial [Prevotella sp.]|nr:carboxypeptidase regulatory-like domain-containing protein [Prevotella sp.]
MLSLLLILFLLLATIPADAQHTVAEETIHTEASSATVRTWFSRIEREGRVVLSYNPAQLDVDRKVYCHASGNVSISRLLSIILADYYYQVIPMEDRKLLIQIKGERLYDLTGCVREAVTNERLLGATVMVVGPSGQRNFAMTDHNGLFNVGVMRGVSKVTVSYVGYAPREECFAVDGNRMVNISLTPVPFEVHPVQVKRRKSMEEMDEVAPSNMVSFSNADLFSQIRILPGVSSASANMDFTVAGGSTDENLFLLEGFPVYNPGHINSMLTLFNGDALKSVSFYNNFIPTQYEGRLSSVTDIRLREGNKQEFTNTLSLDMPSASAVFEGPIVKNKLSYLVGGRHSWLDFFDNLVSEDSRMNHTFWDTNVKLSYDIDSVSSLSLSAYNSVEDFHEPNDEPGKSMLHWNNQLYSLHYQTVISNKVRNASSIAYSEHSIRSNAEDFVFDSVGMVRNRIRSLYVNTEFTYDPGSFYTLRWGLKGAMEKYGLAAFGMNLANTLEPISQISLFFDNRVRITPWMYAQVGFNYVRYVPRNHRRFISIQPRLSLKASIGDNDLVYTNMSRMEQFFHHVNVFDIATPFDFIMPSINGFVPSRSTHFELGWRHYTARGVLELSSYYKRRTNVLALRPAANIEDSDWGKYLMTGRGDSYGASLYYYDSWRRFSWQFSYTLSHSREWFDALPERGKMPATYDIPHVLNGALSYSLGKSSMVTIGGNMHSGKIIYDSWDDEQDYVDNFRSKRDPMRYRVDASYSYGKQFKHSKLLVRLGLYNIMGNPSEDEMFFFFSVR